LRHSERCALFSTFTRTRIGYLREREVLFFLGAADLFFAGRPVLRDDFFAVFLAGTFAPFLRASDNPIAIACLRLVTFFPDLPDVSDPFFFLRIALATVL
jgi:hypothetical protein